MARDILDAAQEAGAEKIDSDAAEAAAILFDVRARQWAYDFRESGGTIQGFYDKYAPAWKAGTLEAGDFPGGGNVRMFQHAVATFRLAVRPSCGPVSRREGSLSHGYTGTIKTYAVTVALQGKRKGMSVASKTDIPDLRRELPVGAWQTDC